MRKTKAPFRFEITRERDIVICTVMGYLDTPSGAVLFDAVQHELTSRPARQILIWNAPPLDGLALDVIPQAQHFARAVEQSLHAFGVVSSKAVVRFTVSMVALATPHKIAVFDQLPDARAWAQRTLPGQ